MLLLDDAVFISSLHLKLIVKTLTHYNLEEHLLKNLKERYKAIIAMEEISPALSVGNNPMVAVYPQDLIDYTNAVKHIPEFELSKLHRDILGN